MFGFLKKEHTNTGLLILRVGIGVIFMYLGWHSLFAGPKEWAKIGEKLGIIGLKIFPSFWGFLITFSQVAGGFLLIIGVLFRYACAFLFISTILIIAVQLKKEGSFTGLFPDSLYMIESAIIFLSLYLTGPGSIRFSSK